MFKLLEPPNQMGDRSIRVSGLGGKMAETRGFQACTPNACVKRALTGIPRAKRISGPNQPKKTLSTLSVARVVLNNKRWPVDFRFDPLATGGRNATQLRQGRDSFWRRTARSLRLSSRDYKTDAGFLAENLPVYRARKYELIFLSAVPL
jgi:ribosomal protein L4